MRYHVQGVPIQVSIHPYLGKCTGGGPVFFISGFHGRHNCWYSRLFRSLNQFSIQILGGGGLAFRSIILYGKYFWGVLDVSVLTKFLGLGYWYWQGLSNVYQNVEYAPQIPVRCLSGIFLDQMYPITHLTPNMEGCYSTIKSRLEYLESSLLLQSTGK